MSDINGQAGSKPLSSRVYPDRIPSINRRHSFQSFADIYKRGRTATETDPREEISFDLDGADTTAVTYRQVRAALYSRMAADAALGQMSRNQVAYEQRLEVLVADSIENTLFDAKHYRQDRGGGTTRILNALTPKSEYDCDHLSYVRGMLMHEADQYAVAQGWRARPTQFFLMSGALVAAQDPGDVLDGHTYVVSAATGNIIEATSQGYGYRPSNRTFEDLIAGYPAATEDLIYAHSPYLVNEGVIIKRAAVLARHPLDVSALGTLRGDPENDFMRHIPKLMALAKKEVQRTKSENERDCLESIKVTSGVGLGVVTAAGPLMSGPHVDEICRASEAKWAGYNGIATGLARELAHKLVGQTAANAKLAVVSVTASTVLGGEGTPMTPQEAFVAQERGR